MYGELVDDVEGHNNLLVQSRRFPEARVHQLPALVDVFVNGLGLFQASASFDNDCNCLRRLSIVA